MSSDSDWEKWCTTIDNQITKHIKHIIETINCYYYYCYKQLLCYSTYCNMRATVKVMKNDGCYCGVNRACAERSPDAVSDLKC